MEPLHEAPSKTSKFAHGDDYISNMPDEVITNILDRLPIRDAIRTDILSRNWRFKWTLLTQLVLDDIFRQVSDTKIISRLLLYLKGSITKFVLYMEEGDDSLKVEDINHCYPLLSRIGIKEFTLINENILTLHLPNNLFSSLELKHLKLHDCDFHPPPGFHGFPNLLSLELNIVRFKNYKCEELIPRSPLLEILKITDHFWTPRYSVKFVEIAKLENLKVLSLSLSMLDNTTMIRKSNISLRMCPFLKLVELNLYYRESSAEDATKWVPTNFPSLKTLSLSGIDTSSGIFLAVVFKMIWGHPNLQTLKIKVAFNRPWAISSLWVDCSKMGQLQLRNVLLASIRGFENEICFIKSLLACSPFLKKMEIHPSGTVGSDEKLLLARKLLNLPRASTTAKMDLIVFKSF